MRFADYDTMFRAAVGMPDAVPHDFQRCFATGSKRFDLIRAPTGSGKTEAILFGWLYRRFGADDEVRQTTPRRLVYCLPMRTLVEQTRDRVVRYLHNLGLLAGRAEFDAADMGKPPRYTPPQTAELASDEVAVRILLGGDARDDWTLHPEQDAILVGTQDMLLSRALNRGYARSRFQWPIDFGLLNNDCLWVFDELQLMGSGVSTSAQLAGLRDSLKTFGPAWTVWMSATMDRRWLCTVDLRERIGALAELTLSKEQLTTGELGRRMTAKKTLHRTGIASTEKGAAKQVANLVREKHQAGTLTLVVLNTVNRAREVFAEVQKAFRGVEHGPPSVLIHSRFRPRERRRLNEVLQDRTMPPGGRIIVSTQVVEAGVDLSARVLITELAPWPSLVQRIGRCHRYGESAWEGELYWLDVATDKAVPYQADELDLAKRYLGKLEGENVSPQALEEFRFDGKPIVLPFEHKHVLRRRDLLDLFDTAPDLSGNDVDVSRFVRGDDPETDVQVFWRDIDKAGPGPDEPSPTRDELCPVPIGEFREFLKKRQPPAFRFDHLDDAWRAVTDRDIRPGLTILLPATEGGYDWNEDNGTGTGWDSGSIVRVTAYPPEDRGTTEEAAGSDPNSAHGKSLTIADHTQNVVRELAELLHALVDLVPEEWCAYLVKAARWHDAGKARDVCQKALHRSENPDAMRLLAKSGRKGRLDYAKYGRKHFRHEFASALAALQHGLCFETAYLIAAHHGRARLAIRALPDENQPEDPGTLFALGVHHGDRLPVVDLGAGETCPETALDVTPIRLGGEHSWTANALRLLAEVGPFRLAYLEALLRAADVRASKKESADA